MWLPCTCGFGTGILLILTFPSQDIFTPCNPLSILKHFQLTTNTFCSDLFKPTGSPRPCVVLLLCAFYVCAQSLQLCLTLQPYRLQPIRLFCPWDSPGKNTGVSCPPPGDLPDPGIQPESPASPALQADSLLLSLGNPLRTFSLFNLAV